MKEIKLENDKDLTTWAVESALMHQSMTNKRFFIIIVILIVALIGTNAGWIYYESQWQYVDTTDTVIQQEVDQQTDGGGDNLFVGGDNYGETDR